MFRKLDLLPSSGKIRTETLTAQLSDWAMLRPGRVQVNHGLKKM